MSVGRRMNRDDRSSKGNASGSSGIGGRSSIHTLNSVPRAVFCWLCSNVRPKVALPQGAAATSAGHVVGDLRVERRDPILEVPRVEVGDRLEAQLVAVVEDRARLDRRERGGGQAPALLVGHRLLEEGVLGHRHLPPVGQHRAPLEGDQPHEIAVGHTDLAVLLALLGQELDPALDHEARGRLADERPHHGEAGVAVEDHRRRFRVARHGGHLPLALRDGREAGRPESGGRGDRAAGSPGRGRGGGGYGVQAWTLLAS